MICNHSYGRRKVLKISNSLAFSLYPFPLILYHYYYYFLVLLLVSYNPLLGLYPRPSVKKSSDYKHSMYLYFLLPLLGDYSVTSIILSKEIDGWLVVWVLWNINLCRLFNAKSIFMQIISSISNNSV